MSAEDSFEALMAGLAAGDEDAAAQVFRRFAQRLIGLARRLDPLVRQKVDPEDVLQSVFNSFFLRCADGQWTLQGWDDLWSLLTVLTVRKCGRRAGHYHAACRDVRREVVPPPATEDSTPPLAALDREPTPEEAAVLAEMVEQVMRGLQGYHRDILQMSLHGYTPTEIAAQVGVTGRSVQRVLQRLRTRVAQLAAREEGQG